MKGLVISTAIIFAFSAGAALAEPPVIDPWGSGQTWVGHSDGEGEEFEPLAGRVNNGNFVEMGREGHITTIGDDEDEPQIVLQNAGVGQKDLPDGAGNAIDGNAADGPGVDNHFDPTP